MVLETRWKSRRNHCYWYNPVFRIQIRESGSALRQATAVRTASHRPYTFTSSLRLALLPLLTMRGTVLGNAPAPGQWAVTEATTREQSSLDWR